MPAHVLLEQRGALGDVHPPERFDGTAERSDQTLRQLRDFVRLESEREQVLRDQPGARASSQIDQCLEVWRVRERSLERRLETVRRYETTHVLRPRDVV